MDYISNFVRGGIYKLADYLSTLQITGVLGTIFIIMFMVLITYILILSIKILKKGITILDMYERKIKNS